jgi:hypothetical protein
LAAILSTNHRFYFHPGRLRQSCVAVWVMATGFGLYQLLGLTGLALAAIYVTAGIRENRRHCQLELILAGKEAGENGSPRSRGAQPVPLTKQPLIGRPLQCWICPWCVAIPDQAGNLQWVFADEVSAEDFSRIRRRALLPTYRID